MTEHLPDELARWPIAPRAILNVPSSAGRTEIRRAYAQRIRHFRPETHPQHFQRIREAMEMLLASMEDTAHSQSFDIELPTGLAFEPQGRPDFRAQSSAQDIGSAVIVSLDSPNGQSSALLDSERDKIWDEYSQRPSAECLQRLQDLAARSDLDPLPFVMGCWATRLTPDLSPKRRTFDWACEGILQTGGSAELIEILLEELRDDITLVTEPVCGQLAERIRDIELTQAYLSARWRLMAQKGFWQRLTREYETTQKNLSYSRPDVWLQMVM